MANPPANRRPGVDADIFQGTWVRGFDVPAGNNDPAADPCDLIISNGKSQIDQTVSNLIFANRKDDVNQPIFVMAQGDTAQAPIGTVNFHIGREEDPNALITTSTSGSLYASYGTPGLWQLQADGVTWVQISDELGGEDLQQTLAIGNQTGGFNIVLTSNLDSLKGNDNAGGPGVGATILGGNATGAAGDGGAVLIQGGTTASATGETGGVSIFSPTATGTGGSGAFDFRTGESKVGGSSGGIFMGAGEAGDVGFTGSGGVVSISGGRSKSSGVAPQQGGNVNILGGQSTASGQGGGISLRAGISSDFDSFIANLPPVAGLGGSIGIIAGSSSASQPGGNVSISAGTGGSGGATGGNIVLTPGNGGGGFSEGEIIGNGVLRADNIKRGNGDPNVAGVPGNEGDVYQRLDLGLGQIWLNTNGTSNGWVQLAQTGDFIEAFEQMSWGWVGPAGTNTSGAEAASYHDVGIWHGLRPNNNEIAPGDALISRGAALNDGPVLSFTIQNGTIGNRAALDLTTGGGQLPHAREHGPILTMRVKPSQISGHRIFIGLTTLGADNQLATTAPGGAESYMGFVFDPAFTNWQTVTRNGLGTSQLNTGISKTSTQASSDAYWFIIDASDISTPTVKYFILDPSLNLVSSIIEIASLPSPSTRLGPVFGILSTAINAGPSVLYLDHAAIVNQGGVVGQGGGPGLGGLSLAQVLNNGNTTGSEIILINQGSGILGVTDDNVGDGASFGVFGGATTLIGNDTGSVTVASGNAFGGGAEAAGATTGFLVLSTGFQFGATSAGDTGIIDVQTGDHAGTDGATGDFVLRTGGFINGAAGTRVQGDILIAPGSFTPNTATTTGEIIIKGGSSSLTNVTGGDVTIMSGENNSAIGDTGELVLETFDVNLDGDSGGLGLFTGSGGTVAGDSGVMFLFTGNAVAGNTGVVAIGTGVAGNGSAGAILMSIGSSSTGNGSVIDIQAGDTIDALGVGGNIELTPGTGLAGDGEVIINGKLNVTGLIDPTGLLLNGQAIVPATVPVGDGLLWIDGSAAPSKLIFTDDTNTDHDISTGGGATSLGALTDVTIAAPAPGEVLMLDGGLQWVNAAGAGGSPFATILAIGNTTGALPIVVEDSLGSSINSDGNLVLNPAVAAGNAVIIDGLSWPEADGPGGFVLTTNGLGQLSFQPGGGGGSGNGFAEAFAQMQWGSLMPPPDLGFASTLNGSGILHDHSDTAPGGGATFQRVDGLARQMIGITPNVAEAGFISTSSVTRPDNLGVYIWKFEMSNTLGVRLFLGLTDGTRNDMMSSDAPATPVNGFIGLGYSTTVPDAGFVFFHNNGPGVGTRVATGVAADTLVHYFQIDATVPGQFTLTLYDASFTQQGAPTVIAATIPGATDVLSTMGALMPTGGANEALFLYSFNVVHRADLLGNIGGGGNQNLASVLGFGGETGGLPITGDNNAGGSGGTLNLVGGNSTGGGGAGGTVNIISGIPDLAGIGAGGNVVVATSPGAGTGDGGSFIMSTGVGGALGGDAGGFSVTLGSGPGAAAGAGGSYFLTAGDGGGTGGVGGLFAVTTGSAVAGNDAGGRINLTTGDGFGAGSGGGYLLTAGDGGANGNGGSFLFNVGTGNGAGVDGTFTVNGEVFINGKLNVTGLIDPTGLLLTSQGVVPFTPAGSDGGIWVNAAGELVYTNAGGDLNLSTAIGGGMTFLDALLTAQYGFLGPGNTLSGPQSYGVFGSSVNTATAASGSITLGQDSDGPFANMATAALPGGGEAFLGTRDLQIQRDSQFKARFKFQVTSPAHTDERIFIGYTDDATATTPNPQLALDTPVPGLQYMALAQSLAGFNLEFVAQGSGGAMAAVFAIPTDTLVHYFEIDASDPSGDVTFTVYDADGVTISAAGTATHTEPNSFLLPDLALATRPFVGITNGASATPRSLDFYDATVITRADVVNAVTGGGSGGTSPLAAVLAAGDTTGPQGIEFSLGNTGIVTEVNPAGGGQDLEIEAGDTSLAGADGGRLRLVGGVDGGAPGKPGGVLVGSDTSVPISATASGAVKLAGSDSATASGATLSVSKGDTGPGDILANAGSAIAPNTAGGTVFFGGGSATGTAQGGSVTVVGGTTAAASSGDGGNVSIQGGSVGPLSTGDEGGVEILAGNAVPPGTIEGNIVLMGAPVFGGASVTSSIGILGKADTTSGDGGPVIFQSGSAEAGTAGDGGNITLQAGALDPGGDHGSIYLFGDGGSAGPTFGTGGDIQLVAATDATNAEGAALSLDGGGPLFGGAAFLKGGDGTGGSGLGGGTAQVVGGTGDTTGGGGTVLLKGGDGGPTGDGASAIVGGGTAFGGVNTGGDAVIRAGVGPGGDGLVKIEGKIDPAVGGGVAGIQYGTFTPVGAPGSFLVSFNVAFGVAPTTVTFTIEATAAAIGGGGNISPTISAGSITTTDFIVNMNAAGPLAGPYTVHWVAYA